WSLVLGDDLQGALTQVMLYQPVAERDAPSWVRRVALIQKGEIRVVPVREKTSGQPPGGPRLVHFRRLAQGRVDIRRFRPVQILRVPEDLARCFPGFPDHRVLVEGLAEDRLGVAAQVR